jgi:hypothetical protein
METLAKGKEIIQKAFTAMGGAKVLNVRDIVGTGKAKATTPMGEMEMSIEMTTILPDKQYQKMTLPMGEMVMALNGKTGWMKMGGGVRDMPTSQVEEMVKSQMLDPVTVLQNLESKDYSIYFYKEDKVNETPAKGIIVKYLPAKALAKWFIDAQTGMILKSVTRKVGQAGPMDAETFYSDYRDVEGVKVAFKSMQQADGKKQMDMELNSIKINSGVKEDLFKKP